MFRILISLFQNGVLRPLVAIQPAARFGTTVMDAADHLTVTSKQSRDSGTHEVIVNRILDMSPTVKHLTLHTPQRPIPFTFKAGQWIDMFIPEVDQVGGFSLTSSNAHLQSTGELHLAVKNSDSPPSNWVHTKCKEGSKVSIRVGGDFFLDLKTLENSSNPCILFIGGGVGINPLSSMIAEIRDMNFTTSAGNSMQVTLLFSAKTHQELIFRTEFDAIQSPCFTPHYFVTGMKDSQNAQPDLKEKLKYGRITLQDIQNALNDGSRDQLFHEVQVYLCGPTGMTSALENALLSLGVKHIFFEKWW